ncbi:hypothetical protein SRHO_G00068430 [Serrasalmus rhombeus]
MALKDLEVAAEPGERPLDAAKLEAGAGAGRSDNRASVRCLTVVIDITARLEARAHERRHDSCASESDPFSMEPNGESAILKDGWYSELHVPTKLLWHRCTWEASQLQFLRTCLLNHHTQLCHWRTVANGTRLPCWSTSRS